MDVKSLVNIIGADFYTGVPDSQLKALCDYLLQTFGVDGKHHIICANEGNCTAVAAGYHMATGKIPVVYLQNSGIGNIINPVASLINDKVYAIPCIFVVGWRGEPGIHDEPQHVFQGAVSVKLLQDMDIETFIIDKGTTEAVLEKQMQHFTKELAAGKQVAFLVRKGALSFAAAAYKNKNKMLREEIIRHIVTVSGDNPIVSTTGKASRELFEIREAKEEGHAKDFLTVGSMGHASSIALGIALQKPAKRIWCVDGDGAALMHMGSLAIIGTSGINNLIHVVINNAAHESVGGQPTVAGKIDLCAIAKGCGYKFVASCDTFENLDATLQKAKSSGKLSFVEVKAAIGAREDLGRPTTTPVENKKAFMEYVGK